MELEEPRERQIHVGHFVHPHPLIEPLEPEEVLRSQRQRDIGAQQNTVTSRYRRNLPSVLVAYIAAAPRSHKPLRATCLLCKGIRLYLH